MWIELVLLLIIIVITIFTVTFINFKINKLYSHVTIFEEHIKDKYAI